MINKYLYLAKELKNQQSMKVNRDHPSNSTFKISENTQKSPGDLKGLAVLRFQ